MDMKPNLVLNQTSSKFFMKMTGTEGLQNPKNWSQDQTRGSIKDKNKTKQKKGSSNQDQRFILKSRTGQHGYTPPHRKGKLAVDSDQPSSQVLLKRTMHKEQGNEEALHHTSFGCHQRFFIFLTLRMCKMAPLTNYCTIVPLKFKSSMILALWRLLSAGKLWHCGAWPSKQAAKVYCVDIVVRQWQSLAGRWRYT